MKTKHLICLAALCGFSTALHAQTPPLTPSGPPSDPTTAMKSLNQVEPRTIIGSLPYTITQPGSYYLTGNLTLSSAGVAGISVQAKDVTIDLNGFTISCTSAANQSAIDASGASGSTAGLVVKNGTIRGLRGDTSNPGAGGFTAGVGLVENGRLENLSITRIQFVAVRAYDSSISKVIVSYCGGADSNPEMFGVNDCVVENCISENNADPGFTVIDGATGLTPPNGGLNFDAVFRNCIARNNTAEGFKGQFCQFEGCSAIKNGGGGFVSPFSTFINCVARFNTGRGIDSTNGVVTDCMALHNTTDGILVPGGKVSGGTATIETIPPTSTGIQGHTISNCTATGFLNSIVGKIVSGCTAESPSHPIQGEIVSDCNVPSNTGAVTCITAKVATRCVVPVFTFAPGSEISATIKRDCVIGTTVVNSP